MKKCPHCAEEIQDEAKKCKHCGEFLVVYHRENTPNNPSNPGVAAVLSFLVPGLGQMYRGQLLEGFVWLVFVVLAYLILFPVGFILHVMCVVKAHNPKANFNKKLW